MPFLSAAGAAVSDWIDPRFLIGYNDDMTKGNPNWGRNKTVAWRFRVRGKNANDEMVTLGKYENERDAQSRRDELVQVGHYRNIRVQPLKVKPVEE